MTANKKENNNKNDPANQVAQRFEESFPETIAPDDHILPSPEDKTELHDQIATLSKVLKEEQDKVEDLSDKLLRAHAEMQNVQRRGEENADKARKFAIEGFAKEILEVVDSLEQGLSYTQNGQATVEHLIEGLNLTLSVVLNALDKHGIKSISPEQGEPFNPTYHEALSMQETAEMEPNRVLLVIQKGYTLNNRLLRPARVVVSKALAK